MLFEFYCKKAMHVKKQAKLGQILFTSDPLPQLLQELSSTVFMKRSW